MKQIKYIGLLIIMILTSSLSAQVFSFQDFIGTWNGTSYSESVQEWNSPMTLVVQSNGFYTDSSGILMPTIYPNTQQSEFDTSTNRLHFRYLSTVYAGQYFYQHYYFELTSYDGYNLELQYNFWDDPEPHPQVQTITLVRAGTLSNKDETNISPEVVKLLGNHPNPFKPDTSIKFSMKTPQTVTLEVYNSRGQKVRTLVNGSLRADDYNVIWNARDDKGRRVPSGLYFYKIKAGTYSASKKMILLK